MVVFGRPVTETILAWDEPSRFAFAIEAATMPGISALAEDYRVADEPGGSSLTWTMAYDASSGAAGLIVGASASAAFRRAGRKLNQLLGRP